MQLAIELPDELGKELLQQANISEFVQEAIKRLLCEQKKIHTIESFSGDSDIIQLTKEEQENFINVLLSEKPVNDKLKRSLLAYKEKKGL